jgi:anaerobic selenocysteine-containing dehydrogenase
VQIEARMSHTGASADEWIPARFGTEGVLALGIAHSIMRQRLRAPESAGLAGQLISGWFQGLPEYGPEATEKATGVAATRVERLAAELAQGGSAVAVIGGAPLALSNGLFNALAVNALNALIGAVESPGGLFFMPSPAEAGGRTAVSRDTGPTVREIAAALMSGRGAVELLVIDGANPVFTAPGAWGVREALERIPFIVGVGCFLDDTTALADLLLPDHSPLETWAGSVPESGALSSVVTVAPPAMRPIHTTRATPDVLLEIGRSLRQPLALPWETFADFVRARFEQLVSKDAAAWDEAQRRGGWWPMPAPRAPETSARGPAARASAGADRQPSPAQLPTFAGGEATYPFHLLPFPSTAFFDGSTAHLPWLQELPDPMTSAMWSSWVEINPVTAGRLGVSPGDVVEIASPQGAIQAAVVVSPGIAPNVVGMPVGQGHQTFTRYATGRGASPLVLLAPEIEPETGTLAWAATRVRLARVGGPDGRLILFAGESRERPFEGGVR